jgi:3-phosphoinositide dependent protein kinase-1
MGRDQDWDDVGAAWDDLVDSGGSDHDDLEWASDGEAPEYELQPNEHFSITGTEIPRGEVDIEPLGNTRPMPIRRGTETTVRTTTHIFRETEGVTIGVRNSSFSGSPPSSSSEGSPDVARGISISPSERSSTEQADRIIPVSEARGRNQAMSPVQGNGTPDD